ncbi:hypothetical protein X946_1754 [Burkholderia sp. ABCPW 111]|nr:hypothetical protein X946_1754 [Burkholderia sp. ABCPW 111]
MTDRPDWLRRATERAVQKRDFTKTATGPYDDDLPFDVWLGEPQRLPGDAWPSRRPDNQQE